jgi:hypothetical protein
VLRSLKEPAASFALGLLTLALSVFGRRAMRWCRDSLPADDSIY